MVANIVSERPYGPGGQEVKIGTKHFRPGTKVYIIDWFPGMCEDIIVIGLARKPKRYIDVVIKVDWIENLRMKLCYDPSVLRKIYGHFKDGDIDKLTKEFIISMYDTIPVWQQEIKKDK